MTAAVPDGSRLFAVSTRDLSPVPGSWPATGMAGSDTLNVDFTDIPAEPVGRAGPHPHVHGANLGMRVSAYLDAGPVTWASRVA